MAVASHTLTLVQNTPDSLLVRKSVFLDNLIMASVLFRERIGFEWNRIVSFAGNVLFADALKLGEYTTKAS